MRSKHQKSGTKTSASGKPTNENASGSLFPSHLIDVESERLILANILTFEEFWPQVGSQLSADLFALPTNARLFRFMDSMAQTGTVPTLASVYRWMIDHKTTPQEFGFPSLSGMAFDALVRLVNPEPWMRALRRAAAARATWRTAERLRLGVEAGSDFLADDVSAAREELRKLEPAISGAEMARQGTVGDDLRSVGLDTLFAAPTGLVASPWGTLNAYTNGGMRPGEVWIAGARPGVGKSTLAYQWALHAAKSGLRVKFLSLEMPLGDMLKRMIASQGRLRHKRLVLGDLNEFERQIIVETADLIDILPLQTITQARTMQEIRAIIGADHKPGLVVIDYLGLIEQGEKFENRNVEVSALSRRLKLAALDHGVPILALHQLNRASDSENRRPGLADLRDSGTLEQDADVVLLLDSPARRSKGSGGAPREQVDLLIAKQRNGAWGVEFGLWLEADYCRFREMER